MPDVAEVDPFDLPEWLSLGEVIWTATSSLHGAHRVEGRLAGSGEELVCDLLGADQAYPRPVLDEGWRRRAHQSWTHGEVLVCRYDSRLTLAVPGSDFTADRALEAVGRFAKAVGADPGRFLVALRL